MSNNKLNKIDFWKNFISFWVLILIISCIFFFNIRIGFTIFEGIYFNLTLVLFILSTIIMVLIIIFVVLTIFYNSNKIIRKKGDIENWI